MKQPSCHRVWFRILLLVFTIETVYIRKEPRLQKLWGCWDRIGRVGRLCNWLTILVDLPTGCSRRLLLHEQHVYLLICFVESMVTHSSHNSYTVGMTGLLGKVAKGAAVSSKPPSLVANFPSKHHEIRCWQVKCTNARSFESNERNLFHFITLDVSLMLAFNCY